MVNLPASYYNYQAKLQLTSRADKHVLLSDIIPHFKRNEAFLLIEQHELMWNIISPNLRYEGRSKTSAIAQISLRRMC